jgi:Fe2+ transport system protein FeoA
MDLDQAPLRTDLRVVAVTGPRPFRRRLLEMGLLPGTPVRKEKVAPLGDPIEIAVRGARLSIRRAEARGIEVAP